MQVVMRRKSDRMNQDIECAPGLAQAIEQAFFQVRPRDIEFDQEAYIERFGAGPHERQRTFVEIGDGEIGPCPPERIGDTESDRMFVRNADDEGTLAGELEHVVLQTGRPES